MKVDEFVILGVDPEAQLWKIPEPTKQYLKYHRDHEFDRVVG